MDYSKSIFYLILLYLLLSSRYVKDCVNEGFTQVTRADKNPIIKFMTGEIDDLSMYPGLTSQALESSSSNIQSIEKKDSAILTSHYKTLNQVMNEERFLHDRKSILMSPSKNFNILLTTVNTLNKKHKKNHTKAVNVDAPDAQRIVTTTTQTYNRYQFSKDEFWKDRLSQNPSNVQITDTEGSLASLFSGNQTSLPEDSNANGDIELSQGQKRSRNDVDTPSKRSKSSRSSRSKGNPIIIIPATISSPINRNNAYAFFQNSTFEMVDPSKSLEKSRKIEIERKKNDGTIEKYEIIDNLLMMEKNDWERVVAIFVTGKDWELKKIPYKNPAEIFHKIRGYFVKIDDNKLPDTIKNWNVKVLTISSHKRYHDSSVLYEFWSDMDEFRKRSK